jgi:hypothetical protein
MKGIKNEKDIHKKINLSCTFTQYGISSYNHSFLQQHSELKNQSAHQQAASKLLRLTSPLFLKLMIQKAPSLKTCRFSKDFQQTKLSEWQIQTKHLSLQALP